jgi:RNA polymerase sigma factor (sigma-70 family)
MRITHELLTREDEAELTRVKDDPERPEAERIAARNRIIEGSVLWAMKYAGIYCRRFPFADRDAMESACLQGMMEAADNYDGSTRFASYATFYMQRTANRVRKVYGRSIKVPVYEKGSVIRSKLSEKTQAALRRIEAANESGHEIDGWVPDRRFGDPAQVAETRDEVRRLMDAIGELNDREALVLRARWGLGGEEEQTLEALAPRVGVSGEMCRRIEVKAFAKVAAMLKQRDSA